MASLTHTRHHRLQSETISISALDEQFLTAIATVKRTNSYPEALVRELMTPSDASNKFRDDSYEEEDTDASLEDVLNSSVDHLRNHNQHKNSIVDNEGVHLALMKLSIAENDIAQMKRLLSRTDSNVNIPDKDGLLPVHYAAIYGQVDILKLLMDNKADVNAKNSEGEVALDFAVKSGNFEVAQFLVQHGANTNSIVNGVKEDGRPRSVSIQCPLIVHDFDGRYYQRRRSNTLPEELEDPGPIAVGS